MNADLRVLIAAEHASARFGGEAALPLHYFRVLRNRGIQVWLITHARTRDELSTLYPDDGRILYIEDTAWHRAMWRLGNRLPDRIAYFTTGFLSRLSTQISQRRMVRRMVREHGITVVHQPMPVSPREPSLLFGFDVPVVIGPMNGAIDYPPAFRKYQGRGVSTLLAMGRGASKLMNRLMPGKLRSPLLLVANERTARSLPSGVKGQVLELVENGVDLALWAGRTVADEPADWAETRFLFMGRLVDWKAVDLLLAAFRQACGAATVSLTVAGDGPERHALEATCRAWGLLADSEAEPGKVFFAGWKSQVECAGLLSRSSVLVLPSLMECGGAVVLEAMAASRPVVATAWGGPADYLDASCGILVEPSSAELFTNRFAQALVALAQSRELRVRMGRAGYHKVVKWYDWEVKVDRIIELYRLAVQAMAARPVGLAGSDNGSVKHPR